MKEKRQRMRNATLWMVLAAMIVGLTGCGLTTQDYSDALSGTWSRSVEENENGYYDQGVIYLTFDPIPEGSDCSTVTAMSEGHIDGSSNNTCSADYKISVKGKYIIDDQEDEYPLNMIWDVNSLSVKIENVKIEDIQADFGASLYDLAGTLFVGGTDTRKALGNMLKKEIKSNCKQALLERNDDSGCYGVEVDGDKLYISGADFSIAFSLVE